VSIPVPPRDQGPTLIITLTGRDRPGVSKALFSALSDFDVAVLDVEQVVLHARLVLGALISAPNAADEAALRSRVEQVCAALEMDVEILQALGDEEAPRSAVHITVIGAPVRPRAIAALAGRIADCGANIDRITRVASWPVTAIEIDVSGAEPEILQIALADEAIRERVDVAVQRGGLARRAKRLVVMDVDSTLIQNEVIDLLASYAGVEDRVAEITERAMNGEIEFADALRERVALLAGLGADAIERAQGELELTPGARTLIRILKHLDHRVGVVSGGFIEVIAPLIEELGIDFAAANSLEIENGRLTGRISGEIIDRAGKAKALERFAAAAGIPLEQTVAIGDGANDLDMIDRAGLGIAFNAKPMVRERADTSLSAPYLDSVLYLLGISRELIDSLDRP
jgi:phosphoserine phosphatase